MNQLSDVKQEELALLIYLFKWLMGLMSVGIMATVAAFFKIKSDLDDVKKDFEIRDDRHKNLEKNFEELKHYVYHKN